MIEKQGVARMGCNRTGPPCSVGCRPTTCPAACLPARRQHYNDEWRWQTPANKTILAH